jgi:hypothetical protein
MSDLIIDRRGLFWRGDLSVPEGQFAHDSCISGTLTIDVNGSIELKLDGVFQFNDERRRLPAEPLPPDFQIAGILFETNERVRLFDILPNSGGGWSTNGPAFEILWPLICFVGLPGSALGTAPFEIKSLSFPLKGYEDWLWLRNVSQKKDDTGFALSYSLPTDLAYELSSGKLEIIFDVTLHGFGIPYASPQIEEQVFFKYTPNIACTVARAAELSRYFDDLFLILTDIDDHLQWPEAIEAGGDNHLTCYYYRRLPARKRNSSYFNLWTTFPQIKEQLGVFVDNWLRKREELGSAFYMYTGTRRAPSIYSEHKFMSFVLGLESLHRRTAVQGSELKEKIERILASVEDKKDKNWLKGRLKNAHEPSLEQRLYEVLSKLPIAFEKKELCKFAKRCADRRNELSHFAGMRDANKQRTFYDELQLLTQPLDFLYHAVILQEVGLSPEMLQRIFLKSWSAYNIKECLKRAGLSVPSSD